MSYPQSDARAAMSVSVLNGYYDRSSNPLVVLCQRHGDERWGDPWDDDDSAAFNARYDDTSGDWCWSPNVGAPCVECEAAMSALPGF